MNTVVNKWDRDQTKPVATKGDVLTPNVKLDANGEWLGIEVTATDAGEPKPSGVASAAAQICTLDDLGCIDPAATLTQYSGQTKLALQMGTKLYATDVPSGTYYLKTRRLGLRPQHDRTRGHRLRWQHGFRDSFSRRLRDHAVEVVS